MGKVTSSHQHVNHDKAKEGQRAGETGENRIKRAASKNHPQKKPPEASGSQRRLAGVLILTSRGR